MNSKIGEALAKRLQSAQDYDTFEIAIFVHGEPAADALAAQTEAPNSSMRANNVEQIRRIAEANQRSLVDYLESASNESVSMSDGASVPRARNIESFWINNSVRAEVSLDTLHRILARPDVIHVELIRRAKLEELMDAQDYIAVGRVGRTTMAPPAATIDATETWSVRRINAPLLWQKGLFGQGILVAVVDSGVNYNHPDLAGQMWQSATYPKHGRDFDGGDDDPFDEQGHGTCCAGIVAGNGASGKKTGVAPKATIIAIRVGGLETQFWQGLQFAIDQGVHVITMSMTWKYPSNPNYPGWRRTCETILAAGILHANSIGNQGQDLSRYPVPYNIATPGNCPPPRMHPLQNPIGGLASPISCGATDDTDSLAGYSGRGPAAWEAVPYLDYPWGNGSKPGLFKPDVCAPGPGTESCNFSYTPGVSGSRPYTQFGGTSSATPHVAGCLTLIACACLRSGNPIVPAQVQEAIENTAVRVVGQSKDKENHYGAGRIDVYAAYRYGVSKGWWDAGVV
jgi:subtilisin family serine protease